MKSRVAGLFTSLIIVLTITAAGTTAIAGQKPVPHGLLTNQIDYWFAAHLNEWDDEGRLLIWEGAIEGEIDGTVLWWFVIPSPVAGGAHNGGQTGFYQARWEIWIDDELVLAGESAGKTVTPDGQDGMWDGHGVVTEAHGKFSPLKGRKIYESGPVIAGDNPPVTFGGTGMFLIF